MRVRGVVVSVLWFAASCTKPNPARQCMDFTCTSPEYPFCDVTGFVSGEPGICVAVRCVADSFGECRDDYEVRCNDAGTNYEVLRCELGCDEAANGCRLCKPNETACTNGKVASCDENGVATSARECPLGCFEAEPRCRDIAPSNGLGPYWDMVAAPPDIDIADGTIDVDTGDVRLEPSGTSLAIPNYLVPAAPGGVPIRVFVVNRAAIQRLVIRSASGVGPAFALLANQDVVITGSVTVEPGVGHSSYPACEGADGVYGQGCGDATAAGGGGANATNGGFGGTIPTSYAGGIGGIAAGSSTLIPLIGGCQGGGVIGPQGAERRDGRGGGAAQFSSRTSIVVEGIVSVRGETGGIDLFTQSLGLLVTGGGAGGSLLFEAPKLELGPNARLLASGGDGAAGCSVATQQCGLGGLGAHAGMAATSGGDASCLGSTSIRKSTGGGGGGLGRVRINTTDATYVKSSSAIEDAALTTGELSTR